MPDLTELYIDKGRWGMVAHKLIEYQNYLRLMASEESGTRDAEHHRACYAKAAKALQPAIREALAAKAELERRIDEQSPHSLPPLEPITDQEILELGREVANDPTAANMERQGRPLTNLEMWAYCRYATEDACSRFAREFVQWLEQVNEQTALAAVTARLSSMTPGS